MFKKILQTSIVQKGLALLTDLRVWSLVNLLPKIAKFLPTSFWSKEQPLLGVAISHQDVQVLLMEKHYGLYKVVHYAHLPLPIGAIIEGKIKLSQKISDTLKQAFILSGCKTNQVVIALPNAQVITKQINLSAELSEFELASEVEFAAASALPLPMESVSLDYHVLGPLEDNPAQVNVQLIASLNAPIQERLEIVQEAGLEAKVVDVECYSLERSISFCLSQLDPALPKEIVVLFDFNADTLSFVALQKGILAYHQEDIFISEELTHIVVEKYNLDASISSYAEWISLVPEHYLVEIFVDIQPLLLKQMVHCFQLFASTLFFNKIDFVFLSGDITSVPGVAEWLTKELDMPVAIANPLKNLHFDETENQLAMQKVEQNLMRVIGLALRGCV